MNRLITALLTAALSAAVTCVGAHAQEIGCVQSSSQLSKGQLEACRNFNWRMKELGADKLFHERFPEHKVFIQSMAPNLGNSRFMATGFLLVVDSSTKLRWSTMNLTDYTDGLAGVTEPTKTKTAVNGVGFKLADDIADALRSGALNAPQAK